jgi:hypothetical protein
MQPHYIEITVRRFIEPASVRIAIGNDVLICVMDNRQRDGLAGRPPNSRSMTRTQCSPRARMVLVHIVAVLVWINVKGRNR